MTKGLLSELGSKREWYTYQLNMCFVQFFFGRKMVILTAAQFASHAQETGAAVAGQAVKDWASGGGGGGGSCNEEKVSMTAVSPGKGVT